MWFGPVCRMHLPSSQAFGGWSWKSEKFVSGPGVLGFYLVAGWILMSFGNYLLCLRIYLLAWFSRMNYSIAVYLGRGMGVSRGLKRLGFRWPRFYSCSVPTWASQFSSGIYWRWNLRIFGHCFSFSTLKNDFGTLYPIIWKKDWIPESESLQIFFSKNSPYHWSSLWWLNYRHWMEMVTLWKEDLAWCQDLRVQRFSAIRPHVDQIQCKLRCRHFWGTDRIKLFWDWSLWPFWAPQ